VVGRGVDYQVMGGDGRQMDLEPRVVELIDREQRHAFRQKAALVGLPAALAAVLIAVLVPLLLNIPNSSNRADDSLYLSIGIVATVLVIFALWQTIILVRERRRYRVVTDAFSLVGSESVGAASFANGIAGVSIAMGIEAPELVAGREAVPSATFLAPDGRPVIVVSDRLLSGGIAAEEAEGLMAHELGHVMLGRVIHRPSALSAYMLFADMCAVCIVLLSLIVLTLGSGNQGPGNIVLTLGVFAIDLGIVQVLWIFMSTKLTSLERHSDLLADSIAAQATRNPDALKRAIEKLKSAGLTGRFVLEPKHYLRLQVGVGVESAPYLSVIPPEPSEVQRRLENLDEIARGRWQVFDEIEGARVRMRAAFWR